MIDRSRQRKTVLNGPVVPVPTSPFYSVFNTLHKLGSGVNTWEFVVPPDGMIYTICNFTVVCSPTQFIHAGLVLADAYVFNKHDAYAIVWSPGVNGGIKIKYGDHIHIMINSLYATVKDYYWQVDFWREPQWGP